MPKRAPKTPNATKVASAKDKLLPRMSMMFFRHARTTAILWLALTLFGVVSYTSLLKHEGFPSINIPIVIVNGSYAVNDAGKVDKTLAAPVSEVALKQSGATSVNTSSEDNFFTAIVRYKENVDSTAAKKSLEAAVTQQLNLPKGAKLMYNAPYFGVTGGSAEKIDATVSLYADGNMSLQQLTAKAEEAVKYLNAQHLGQVDNFFVVSPYASITNPMTGQEMQIQRTFDRYGERQQGKTAFYQSVIIGATKQNKADVIKFDTNIRKGLEKLENQKTFHGFHATVSASNAPTINDSLSELQRVLLEGLLAVLIVGSLLIAVRASLITVVSMLTVIATTLGLLYVLGYSLNVITLFAVILGLSLIVDDTIIMVEAIDASRKREKDAATVVAQATRKISRAMVAATLTAALSFAPLIFVGGVLGSFIRAIPVTIISALLISLLVALVFIPFFARFALLGKKQLGEQGNVREIAAGVERRIANALARPMLWAQHHRKREFGVGITAVAIGLLFIAAAGFVFTKVTFNIFPATKDTNQLAVALTFAPGTSVAQAEAIAERADTRTAKLLGEYFVDASYYSMANAQSGTLYVNITPYRERKPASPELVDQLNKGFKDFKEAKVNVYQLDVGPPSSAFTVNITATKRQAAEKLATDMATFLQTQNLKRPSGEVAHITGASVDNTSIYKRVDNKPVIGVSAEFDGKDTSTLTTLAKSAVKKEFDDKRLASYGLKSSDVSFELGQEQENQDSFKTLALAFPLLMLVIYLLLALQFRSLLQPLLIFTAIPFSLFGVTSGLYITNNAFSFFAMLGFFALIGLSIKNTILLTDYANQARRGGMTPIDAAVAALGERFRPLIATSLTAVFSLIPLAVTSPFWQGLATVLIFGLLSSTLLVVTIFPYFYLGAEYLRLRVSRKAFLLYLGVTVVFAAFAGVVSHKNPAAIGAGVVVAAAVSLWYAKVYARKRRLV